MATEDRPDRLGMRRAELGDVEAQLEPGTAPVDPGDAIAEAALGQGPPSAAVASAMPESGWR